MERVKQVTRPQPVGHDPQREHGRDAQCERPPAALGQRDIGCVRRDEEPHLGTRQPRQPAEHERPLALAAQVQLDRPQHERHEQRLDVARRQVAQPVGAGEEREHRQHPGDPATGARPEPERQQQRRETRGPHDHEPEARRRGAGEGQRRGEEHSERLPAGACDGAEVRPRQDDLLAEDDPRPRVIGRSGREREGGRGEGQASHPRQRRAHVSARQPTSGSSTTGGSTTGEGGIGFSGGRAPGASAGA